MKERLFKYSLFMFFALKVGDAANYLFQIFMGRMLSVSDYGLLNSLLSLFVIVMVPGGTIVLVMGKYISEHRLNSNGTAIGYLLKRFLKWVSILALTVFFLLCAMTRPIGVYLRVPDTGHLLILWVAILLAFIVPVNMGVLQGLQFFKWFGLGIGLSSVFKLAAALVFVRLGLGLNGALIAYIFAAAATFVFTFMPIRHFYFLKVDSPYALLAGEVFSYGRAAFLTVLAFMAMTSVDVIFIRHYFPGPLAGHYAAAALFAKIIIYLPSALALTLFPMASELDVQKKDASVILRPALAASLVLCAAPLLVFQLIPRTIMKFFMGVQYSGAEGLLRGLSLAIFPYGLSNLLLNYALACRKTGYIKVLMGLVLLEILFILAFHKEASFIIFFVGLIGYLLLFYLFFFLRKT